MAVERDRKMRSCLDARGGIERPARDHRRIASLQAAVHQARSRAALVLIALLTVGCLAGCTQSTDLPQPESGSATDTPTSPSPSNAAAPLRCDDLVPQQQIVAALAGGRSADDWVVVRTSIAAGLITTEKAVQGAGGLSCSWSAGPPASETTEAVLTVSVLPDAADDWGAQLYGDGPTPDRRTFADVAAAASCGDPGCGASAAVGSSWVRVDLVTGSREGGDSVFAKETDDQVFAALRPAIESAFRTVQQASAQQLRFPDHLTGDSTPADCRTYLTKTDIAGVLNTGRVDIDTGFQPSPAADSITGAAENRIGSSVCSIEGHAKANDYEAARITVAPGQAWAVDDLAGDAASRGTFHVTTVKGQATGERAVTDCDSSGRSCTVVFSLGSAAIQIENTERSIRVAEAILAGAR